MITNYSELQAAIVNWLNRDPGTDRVKEFIHLAEAGFRRVLKTLDNEVRSRATVPTGGFVALPDDYNGIRDIYTIGNPNRPLTIVSPSQLTDWGNLTGDPYYATVVDGQFKFNPDIAGEEVEVVYYRKLTPLSDTQTTNYLIDEYPDVYLAGALVQAKGYLKEDDVTLWLNVLNQWVSEMDQQSKDQKYAAARKRVGQNTTIQRLG